MGVFVVVIKRKVIQELVPVLVVLFGVFNTMTEFKEVLVCYSHIASHLGDIVNIMHWETNTLERSAVVFPVQMSKEITCYLCPKNARFLVRE